MNDDCLADLVAAKTRVAGQLRLIDSEGDEVTAKEARDALFKAFDRVGMTLMPWQQIEADRERLCRERGLKFHPRTEAYYRSIDKRLVA